MKFIFRKRESVRGQEERPHRQAAGKASAPDAARQAQVMPARDKVTLGILAGGRATRLGGVDKAMLQYRGNTLLSRTVDAAGSGFCATLLSYNGDNSVVVLDPRWQVLGDLRAGFPGPMAGLETMLVACETDWLLTLPVDARDVPADLCTQLMQQTAPRFSWMKTVAATGGLMARRALSQGGPQRIGPRTGGGPNWSTSSQSGLDICPRRLEPHSPEDFQ